MNLFYIGIYPIKIIPEKQHGNVDKESKIKVTVHVAAIPRGVQVHKCT